MPPWCGATGIASAWASIRSRSHRAELIARITARHAVRDLFVENPPIENIVAQFPRARQRKLSQRPLNETLPRHLQRAIFALCSSTAPPPLAGLWTQIFFGLVMIMVYEAFYRSTDRPQPMTFPQVVSYVWLGQALLALLPWNVDAEVEMQRRGGVQALLSP